MVERTVNPNTTHPGCEPGRYESLSIEADTKPELADAVSAAESEGWILWIAGYVTLVDGDRKPGAYLYQERKEVRLRPAALCETEGTLQNMHPSSIPVSVLGGTQIRVDPTLSPNVVRLLNRDGSGVEADLTTGAMRRIEPQQPNREVP